MKKIIIATSVIAVALAASMAGAQTTAATPATASSASSSAAPYYSTDETPLGDLLDNPVTKAILQKYVPQLVASDQIDQARGMTLKAIQPYAGDTLTDKILEEIDAELAKVPAPK